MSTDKSSREVTQFNPISEWEEYTQIKHLTLYDINRDPRTRKPKGVSITLSRKELNEEIKCVICLGILKNTRVSSVCLHRFCYDCIRQSYSEIQQECPMCRAKIKTIRHFK
jgi:hypothetical protein